MPKPRVCDYWLKLILILLQITDIEHNLVSQCVGLGYVCLAMNIIEL